MKLTVLHHNNCFDGLASAAVFTRFFLREIAPGAETGYVGLAHRPNQKFIPEELFDGDVNGIVDFKYSPSARLTWWFDHHQSAFLSPEDEKHFRTEISATKIYDPGYRSCTKLIADTAAAKWGFVQPELDDLIQWADVIDGARYEDARTAVELKAPALRLMLVIEATRDQRILEKIIRDMQQRPLDEIIADPEIEREFRPLFERHLRTNELIGKIAVCENRVVYFDLVGYDVEGYSKFVPYYLYPECVYSVSVIRTRERTKVSVGFNPWSRHPRRHNLASICERYNGGGHAVVGAISLRPDEVDLARETAQAIAKELRS
jgi:nanoRNase/pAp phosphatase (c-di-AMP/oligoRNAs hydrolase)